MTRLLFVWAINLIAQNFMFTIVSRARNSGSLRRHVVAAMMSNGIYILQFQIMLGPMLRYLNGSEGRLLQFGAALFYSTFTVLGSVAAHCWSLRSERGRSAVGASARYAQIPREDWDKMVARVAELESSVREEAA